MSTSLVYPQLDAAIAAFETGGNPNSAAALANNPGALTAPGGVLTSAEIAAGATGTTPVANGQYLAVFPSASQGEQAEDQLVGYYAGQGDTLSQLITNWSVGPSGTPTTTTNNYINSVAAATGAQASTPVSSLASSNSGTSSFPVTGTATSSTGSTGSSFLPAWLTNLSTGQIAAFILGIVAIIGGFFLLAKSDIVKAVTA